MSPENVDPLERIRCRLDARKAAHLYRNPVVRSTHDTYIDLAGNDYLGMARDARVVAAAAAALRNWGAGSTGSRLVTGTTQLHIELECALAAFVGGESALVFSSGYMANLGVLDALGGPDVTVVSDANNHASIIDACRLSRSQVRVARHSRPENVDALLRSRPTQHAVVVTDAVFSVEGDLAPLAELYDVTRRHGAILWVDEAHSLGVVGPGGRGAVAAAGLGGLPDIVQTVTLSKSLGSQGGAVIAESNVVDLLRNTARPIIFDTALAPAAVAAALESLHVIEATPAIADRVRDIARQLAGEFGCLGPVPARPDAAVLCVVVGEASSAIATAEQLLTRGLRVACFRPPTVPVGRSCIRVSARADLTARDLNTIRAELRSPLTVGRSDSLTFGGA